MVVETSIEDARNDEYPNVLISCMSFNDGTALELEPGSIVVFTGANYQLWLSNLNAPTLEQSASPFSESFSLSMSTDTWSPMTVVVLMTEVRSSMIGTTRSSLMFCADCL